MFAQFHNQEESFQVVDSKSATIRLKQQKQILGDNFFDGGCKIAIQIFRGNHQTTQAFVKAEEFSLVQM
jgi:hypothetical protein